ncbi:RnaseH-domain-containing protein [Schizophyllum commune Tattone D]|nr:RnaseH-domain-containing protein [Schizophyllum commune Tattone D]
MEHAVQGQEQLPAALEQSNQTGEMLAAKAASKVAPADSKLSIVMDSKWVLEELTKWLTRHEDMGYIDKANATLTCATVARLRARYTHTRFKWVKGHAGHIGNERADRLAGDGARKTEINLTQILSDTEDTFGIKLTRKSVWRAIRNPAISLEAQYFLWMLTHDGYKVGTYWLKDNFNEDQRRRGECAKCGSIETMHHILFDCDFEGQATVWTLAEQLWRHTKHDWPMVSLGTVVTAGCLPHRNSKGRPILGLNCLWAIIMSETAKFIWVIRCERVIHNENREFTADEVKSRWYAAIECRLTDDRHSTCKSLEKRVLDPGVVNATWKPVIEGYQSLPPAWVGDTGVLVGIKRGCG